MSPEQDPTRSRGETTLGERAVSRIVAAATASVPGTRRVERIAGRSHPRFDVMIDDRAGSVSIEAFIAVSWPSPVTAVAEAVRATVADRVRAMTGLRVEHVNVVVGPVIRGDRRITREEIAAARPPAVHPVRTRPTGVRSPAIRPARVGGHTAARLTGADLDEVRTAEGTRPRGVGMPAEPRTVPVTVGEGPAEVPVIVAEPPAEVRVSTPQPRPLAEVALPEAPRVRSVSTPRGWRPARVHMPPEWPLRPVHATTPRVTRVRPPALEQKGADHGRVR